jgi:threonyl-tRNA synthetase
MERRGLHYGIGEGEGTFYGPKIDLHMTDSIGRSWQLGTVQLDYLMPERFEMQYTDADDRPRRPVMIHRALLGSYERFIGILIEHLAGEFPVWLAPVQAIVLPIAERHRGFAARVRARLVEAGARVQLDDRDEKVGRKVRDAEVRKIPYMLVVGDREAQAGAVSVRRHRTGDQGTLPVDAFADRLRAESASRAP